MRFNKGDLVLIKPFDNIDTGNEVLIIDDTNKCLLIKTFDNKKTFLVTSENYNNIVKLQRNEKDINLLLKQTKQFISDNTYNDLQSTIDIIDEFDHLIYDYEENSGEKKFKEYFGAFSYDISLLIENLKYDRKTEWTCNDLKCLETAYLYSSYLCDFVI